MERIEEWKQVPGWNYDVSSYGLVRNRNGQHILAQPIHKSGYRNVQLWSCGMYKTFLVHRLVAAAFVGDQPSKKHEVAHNDGDRLNNVSSNLRWVLHTENMQDRDRHGTTATGSRNGKFKHPDTTVVRVRELQASGLGSRRISKMLGMSRGTVYSYMKNTRRQSIEHRGQQS